jgi:hypothetical protein
MQKNRNSGTRFLNLNQQFRETSLTRYVESPFYASDPNLSVAFEKKVCRNRFKRELSYNLPVKSTLHLSLSRFDKQPNIKSSKWRPGADKRDKNEIEMWSKRTGGKLSLGLKGNKEVLNGKVTKFKQQKGVGSRIRDTKNWDSNPDLNGGLNKADFTCSGVQLMSATWLLDQIKKDVIEKKNIRPILNAQIRDTEALMNKLQSSCPVLGVRLEATGRIGHQKKGMAQKISRSLGKVPLGSFRFQIDYSQGIVVTKLGVIGIKVWICYA